MKFLADENVPGAAVLLLRAQGLDVAWVAEDAPGSDDVEVLLRSSTEERILLTLDKDFGGYVFQGAEGFSVPPGVILFRLDTRSPSEFSEIALAALQSRSDWSGFFTVVTRSRIRMRPFPAP